MPLPDDLLPPWRVQVDWSADPRLAYQAGLEDGYALAREEIDAEADRMHRAAVGSLRTIVDRVDYRRAVDADAGRVRPGDYPGQVAA